MTRAHVLPLLCLGASLAVVAACCEPGACDDQEDILLQFQSHLAEKLGDTKDSESLYHQMAARYQQALDDSAAAPAARLEAGKQLAHLQLDHGKTSEALRTAVDLHNRYPDDRAVIELLGEVYDVDAQTLVSAGRRDEAIERYRSVLTVSGLLPDRYTFTNLALAHLYLQRGDVEQGLALYHQVIQADGDRGEWSAAAHFGLGRYYAGRNQRVEAAQEFETIRAKQPQTSWVTPAETQLQALQGARP